MKLPGGEHAIVPLPRITGYLLNPAHPVGKHKARVFAAALGLKLAGAETLRAWIADLAVTGDAEPGLVDQNGQRFAIRGLMRYKHCEATVRTAWIIRAQGAAPEFLTAFVE